MNQTLPSVTALARFTLPEPDAGGVISLLESETRWELWVEQIEAHGLTGLASKHIDTYQLPIPKPILLSLKALNMRQRALANARHEALSELLAIYQEDNIPVLALKGAALMPHVYKEAELRPMRDTDLLVPLSQLEQAAKSIEKSGFAFDELESKFTQGIHQLPNATKHVNGFICSVEIHKESIPRDVKGTLPYPDDASKVQRINWNDLEFDSFDDVTMLHQVSRHLEGLHPKNLMKLINMVDVVIMADLIERSDRWQQLKTYYPHVINTLECLHLITPLPANLQARVNTQPLSKNMSGVGVIMGSFRSIMAEQTTFRGRLKALLFPSQWWLHLHYNVSPQKSLWLVRLFRHPTRVITWVLQRVYFGLFGASGV